MYTALVLRVGRRKIYAIEIARKQVHQVIAKLCGNLEPFKYDDMVLINLNTNEMTLIKREVANDS